MSEHEKRVKIYENLRLTLTFDLERSFQGQMAVIVEFPILFTYGVDTLFLQICLLSQKV